MRYILFALILAFSSLVHGKTIWLSNGQGCVYDELVMDGAANVTVFCDGFPPINPSTFSIVSTTGVIVPPFFNGIATVSRVGGPTEALMVIYTLFGCLHNMSGGIMMLSGQSIPIPFTTGPLGSTCTIMISAPAGHRAWPDSRSFSAILPAQPLARY